MRTKSKDISKKQKVLNYLERYGSIDRQTALTHFKIWSLGSIIQSIRKQLPNGVKIETQYKKFDTTRYILINPDGQPVFSRFIKPKPTA